MLLFRFKSLEHCMRGIGVLLLCAGLLACSEDDDFDLAAPTLEITSPLPGDDISGSATLTLTGTVSSDVISVSVTHNGATNNANLVGTDFSINLTLLPRSNEIIAKAQDATGNSTAITFTLFYPELTFTDGMDAALVIGQADFISNTANQGLPVAANTLSGVTGALFKRNQTVLYIPDSGNHRVLAYNAVPEENNGSASFALGQSDLTSNTAGTTATQFTSPGGAYATDDQFFVADTGNNRVLIWDAIPETGSVDASYVVGQTLFTTNAAGCSDSTLTGPGSVFAVNDKLVVLDAGNNRVLIWNTIPATDGTAADIVIGQQNMNACLANDSDGSGTIAVTASTLNNPGGIWTDGTYLLVADTDNHRVLVWDTFPTTNGQAADWVIGQTDGLTAVAELSNSGLDSPHSVNSNGNQIFVADSGNARVLIWNSFPAANKPVADNVIGQADFTSNTPTLGQNTLTSADNVFVDRNYLYAVDGNRVLMFENQ